MEYALFPPAGFISQNECYVRIFVMKYIAFGNTFLPDGEIAVFCPMLIVSNPLSAFAGRDVLGFPKLFGNFDPFSAKKPFTTISTEVFTSFDQEVEATPLPVVEIKDAGKQVDYLRNAAKDAPFSLKELTDTFVKMKSTGFFSVCLAVSAGTHESYLKSIGPMWIIPTA